MRFAYSWEQRKLSEYLDVSNEKNTEDIFTKQDVLSVSGDFGIVNQIEFQGRSFAGASVSNYGVVHTGDVVYTKSPLNSNPYGIIKTNKGKPGIVSTLYAVYHPKENVDPAFVQTYFEQHARMNNYMHPLVNKGAKNDMKVSSENALKGDVMFPDIAEQCQIVALFAKLDNLITLHQCKQNHKKEALMSYTLTKYEKETVLLYNQSHDPITISTYDPGLRRRLREFAARYPEMCWRVDKQKYPDYAEYEIKKDRVSIRLLPPMSEEKRRAASEKAKAAGLGTKTDA